MVLLERVTAVAQDTLAAEVIVRADGMFDNLGTVPSFVGVEYMAQAIAAWAGYHAKQRGEPVIPGQSNRAWMQLAIEDDGVVGVRE